MWISELLGRRQEQLKWDTVGEIDASVAEERASYLAKLHRLTVVEELFQGEQVWR